MSDDLDGRQHDTLERLFAHPTSGNIEWICEIVADAETFQEAIHGPARRLARDRQARLEIGTDLLDAA